MDKKKVLVVDDDQFLQDIICEKLEKAGIACTKAYDGYEAIEAINKEKFDLILLDLIMPGMDGITVTKKLKSQEETKAIPILILTNLSDDSIVSKIKEFGGAGYLIKNEQNIDAIVEAINNII